MDQTMKILALACKICFMFALIGSVVACGENQAKDKEHGHSHD
jgi:hypothetical protein